MNKNSLSLFVTTVILGVLHSSVFGEWVEQPWNPAWTNCVYYAPPAYRHSGSVITNWTGQKGGRLMSTPVGRISTTGLRGNLPAADDSRIRDLARGLQNDWKKCFEFVRNQITYAPYPYFMKGPERTLLDREGNAPDQSLLLCALLKAAGYSGATVMYMPYRVENGVVTCGFYLPLDVALKWRDAKTKSELSNRFNSFSLGMSFTTNSEIAMGHYWVALPLGERTIYLDPAVKPSVYTEATGDVLRDSGYDHEEFLRAAGGVVGDFSVSGISEIAVTNYLTTLVGNLRRAWTNANVSPQHYLRRWKTKPREPDEPYFVGSWGGRRTLNRLISQLPMM